MVSPFYPPLEGGVERHVFRLAAAAAHAGHEVEVFTQTAGESSHEHEGQILVHRIHARFSSTSTPVSVPLLRLLRADVSSFDIVHAHNYHALPLLYAGLARPAALVITPHFHGTSDSSVRRLLHLAYRPIGRPIVRGASAVIAVSQAEADLIVRQLSVSPAKLHVIPNGVDPCIASAKPFPDAADQTVLVAGRLAPYKHHDIVVQALASLAPEVHLVIAGDGPEREEIERAVVRGGLGNRVTWVIAPTDDTLHRWYRTARVLVSLSELESFGLVAAEAAYGGARLVLSDIAAHRELLTFYRLPGEIVPVGASRREVAQAIRRQLETNRLGPGVTSVLSWDQVSRRLLDAYDQMTLRRH